MKTTLRRKINFISGIIFVILFGFASIASASNYFWRIAAVNNIYTNVGNWETVIGGGISPATAPGISDNVFFHDSSSFTSINFNGGFCRNFNFTAAKTFNFSGTFTINGSIFANGNATLNIATGNVLNFTGSGSDTLNMGTTAARILGPGNVIFENNAGTGTYTLVHDLTIVNPVLLNTQSFNSNSKSFTVGTLRIQGAAIRTINFSNSTVTSTIAYTTVSTNLTGIDFYSPNTTTTYTLAGTRFVMNHTSGFSQFGNYAPNLNLSFQSLTIISPVSATFMQNAANNSVITMDSLILNVPSLVLGSIGIDNAVYGNNFNLNAAVINIIKPLEIKNFVNATLLTDKIIEPNICLGQSFFLTESKDRLKLNTTTPITTNTIAYRGVIFGGSGVSAGSNFNLGIDSGSVTWVASPAATNFWWVGGTGNWNDPAKWSIIGSGGAPQTVSGCLPNLMSDVTFDANSFTASQTVTITGQFAYCKNISFTGINRGLLTGLQLYINGSANFTGARGIVSSLIYIGSGSGNTIASGTFFSYLSPQIRFNGTGTYTLLDKLESTTFATSLYHLSGNLNTSGYSLTLSEFSSRSLPGNLSNPRNLDISNSLLTINRVNPAGGFCFLDNSYLNSFTATGSHIKQITTQRFTVLTSVSTAIHFLPLVAFNDVSFMAASGINTFYSYVSDSTKISYKNVNFLTNANIISSTNSHTVENYNLSSGLTYQFTGNVTFTITGAINHVATGCEELVRIQSSTPGVRARLQKTTGTFTVNGAMIKDINASADSLVDIDGVDLGNNNNVKISSSTGRDMFWVNDSGSWSNGPGHWSIGVSGGNPAVTNPLGCIPRPIDNVFFDANSFTAAGKKITIDIDGNCKNMFWNAAAGADAPVLDGLAVRVLSVYGSLELAVGMTSLYTGAIDMMGISTTLNANSMKFNGIALNNLLEMRGGGRYDLLDSIKSSSGVSLYIGNFVSHSNYIRARALYLDASAANAADISNSNILLSGSDVLLGTTYTYSYFGIHAGSGNWNANGSSIFSNADKVTMRATVPVTYGNVTMNNTFAATVLGMEAANTSLLTFKTIKWLLTPVLGSSMLGNITVDTLVFPASSINKFMASRTYTIKDTIIAYGTPCNPVTLKSGTPGTTTSFKSSRCNFDVNFGFLKDIVAGTCTAAQNKVIGTDGGGNSNWTFTTIPDLSKLGNDTSIFCGTTPFDIDAIGFGSIPGITYLWSTGAVSRIINVTSAGTYSVTVNFGPSCEVADDKIISCATVLPLQLSELTGVATSKGNQLSWDVFMENNVAKFIVEHSADGHLFFPQEDVKSLGNSNFKRTYTTLDAQPFSGNNFYRIKMEMLEGTSFFTNTIRINDSKKSSVIAVFPNPANDKLNIEFAQKGIYNIVLKNAFGQVIFSEIITVLNSAEITTIPRQNWNSGLYFLQINNEVKAISFL